MTPQLCLGTVQFGLSYGITNSAGQVAEEEVRRILDYATQEGIPYLDTAQAYGKAEKVLGRAMPKGNSFALISKLSAQKQPVFTAKDQIRWEDSFFRSCNNLRKASLYAFLLHSSADLRKPGGHYLRDWLLSLRARGLVQRLGISIYSADDLEGVAPSLLQLVQLPLSLYDQRLLSDGTIDSLVSIGCVVHARSIYLQGLLLKSSADWPNWISQNNRNHHLILENYARARGLSLIDLSLGFIRAQKNIEAAVLGLCSTEELHQLTDSWRRPLCWEKAEWKSWAPSNNEFVDPRFWPAS